MNCFNHENVPAVAVCKECGRAMCYDCAMVGGKYDTICPECKSDHYKVLRNQNRKKIAKITILTAIIAIVGAIVAILLGVEMSMALVVAGGVIIVVFLLALLFNITKGGSTYKKVQAIISPDTKKKKTKGVVTVVNDNEEISSGRIETDEEEYEYEEDNIYDNMP